MTDCPCLRKQRLVQAAGSVWRVRLRAEVFPLQHQHLKQLDVCVISWFTADRAARFQCFKPDMLLNKDLVKFVGCHYKPEVVFAG